LVKFSHQKNNHSIFYIENSRYNLTACQSLERMLPIFAETIYNNVGAKSIGVDLSQQARYLKIILFNLFSENYYFRRDKCQSCHSTLHEIRSLLEERLKTASDSSLRQTLDDSLRLLNTYERS
jgi:hypothetical protein